jgi:serine/threonine protein kinase
MISLCCSECGKKLPVRPEAAGRRVRCPSCGRIVAVPPVGVARASGASHAGAGAGALAPPAPLPPTQLDLPRGEPVTPAEGLDPLASAELCDFLAPAQAADEIGRLGPYRVLQILGAGGMGVVYRAEDPLLQRQVALKAMLPALAASASARQRFLREARAAAAIEHDHIVAIHQVGEDQGIPFLAMPLLQGEALDERLQREPVLPPAEAVRIGRQIAEGLAAAHERGLIHRDIKPANVWLEGRRGRVKILDFGLARAAGEASTLTRQGMIVGTPAYMAPEQAAGTGVDHRGDLFSLGCILYQVTTGETPFRGGDALSVLVAVAQENPVPPQQRNPQVPVALSALVMRLLAKKPEDRPASAQAVVGELQAIEAALAANPAGPAAPRRARTLWIVAAVVGALVLAVGGAAVILLRH